MSAYMVSQNALSAVTDILIELSSIEPHQQIYSQLYIENQKSMNAKYDDEIKENPNERYIPIDDLHENCQRKHLSTHDRLCCIENYIYQACEHKEFFDTPIAKTLKNCAWCEPLFNL